MDTLWEWEGISLHKSIYDLILIYKQNKLPAEFGMVSKLELGGIELK